MEQEQSLIKAAQAGDQNAFGQLLNARYDTIYRFALKWCGSVSDAEDITQQACIKLGKGIGQYRGDAAFTTWLYRLVINCAKDWQRTQARHSSDDRESLAVTAYESAALEVGGVTGEETSGHAAEAALYLQQVLQQVSKLGEGFKETLVLVFGEGMNHAEAAEVLGIKESTVSWRIHQVRKHLNLLNAEGGNYE
ncbi:ECF RNA polymerase sigma-E factor [Thalassocella blandensis]|nr:ECF RNA polymerase sigma-E factor [Thalassocella blandensis]